MYPVDNGSTGVIVPGGQRVNRRNRGRPLNAQSPAEGTVSCCAQGERSVLPSTGVRGAFG